MISYQPGWKTVDLPVPKYGEYDPGSRAWAPVVLDPTEYADRLEQVLGLWPEGITSSPALSTVQHADNTGDTVVSVGSRPDLDLSDVLYIATNGIQYGTAFSAAPAASVGWPVSVVGKSTWEPSSNQSDRLVNWICTVAPGTWPALYTGPSLTPELLPIRWRQSSTDIQLAGVTADAVAVVEEPPPSGPQTASYIMFFAQLYTTSQVLPINRVMPGLVITGRVTGIFASPFGRAVYIPTGNNMGTTIVAVLPTKGYRINQLLGLKSTCLAFAPTGVWVVTINYEVDQLAALGPDMPGTVVDAGNAVLFCSGGRPYVLAGRHLVDTVGPSRSFLPLIPPNEWDDYATGTYAVWDASRKLYHVLLRNAATRSVTAWFVYDFSKGWDAPVIERMPVPSGIRAIGQVRSGRNPQFAHVVRAGTNLQTHTWLAGPGPGSSLVSRWRTPWFPLARGIATVLRKIQLLGIGNGAPVELTVQSSVIPPTVVDTRTFSGLTWSGELSVEPDLRMAEYYRIEVRWGGQAALQGIRLVYEEVV